MEDGFLGCGEVVADDGDDADGREVAGGKREVSGRAAVAALPPAGTAPTCGCATAAQFAILTQRDLIPAATRERLRLIFGAYLD